MSAVSFGDGRGPGQGLRWTAIALLVAGVHVGAGWWLAGHPFAAPPQPDTVAGVTIDLDPVAAPVAPSEAPQPPATGGPEPAPQVAEAPDAQPDPPPAVEPPPITAAASPPEPPPPASMPEVVPPPAAVPSEAVLAPPPPPRPVPPKLKPVAAKPPKPDPPRPDPRRVAHEKVRQEAREAAAEDARRQRRAARAEARAARAAVARQGGGEAEEASAPAAASSGAAVSTWRGEVIAHLRSYTPASPNGASGDVRVAFTVDRGGRVTSASLSGSSGDAELDRAAVAMVRRASPVPAPPPELGGPIDLAVPVRFR